MKAEIMISGAEEPRNETDNEKQKLENYGDHADIDYAYRFGLSIQTSFGSVCIRCDSVRKGRNDIG